MSATQSVQQYVDKVASALNAALCLQAYPSPKLERCSAPQIELNDRADLMGRTSKIARRDDCCLIEESINSVRVSLRLPTVRHSPLSRQPSTANTVQNQC